VAERGRADQADQQAREEPEEVELALERAAVAESEDRREAPRRVAEAVAEVPRGDRQQRERRRSLARRR
jgi:hypothetical protein